MRERLIKVISTLRQQIGGRREPVPGSPEAQRAYVARMNRELDKAGFEFYRGQVIEKGDRARAKELMD